MGSQAFAVTLALAALPLLSACAAGGARTVALEPGAVVLFQGDSITDAHRNRATADQPNEPSALGNGYAALAAAELIADGGATPPLVYNRGISGHKVFQLAARWDRDCIALDPDLVSILIGVNDIWHTKSGNYDGTVERYERDYDALLARTREALPGAALVVCEPFVLRCGVIDDSWFPEFDAYRAAARRVAETHGALFVPFQSAFDGAITEEHPPEHWAPDGVHPSAGGAALMARTWLETVRGR